MFLFPFFYVIREFQGFSHRGKAVSITWHLSLELVCLCPRDHHDAIKLLFRWHTQINKDIHTTPYTYSFSPIRPFPVFMLFSAIPHLPAADVIVCRLTSYFFVSAIQSYIPALKVHHFRPIICTFQNLKLFDTIKNFSPSV